jgi:outer membrane protein TolC
MSSIIRPKAVVYLWLGAIFVLGVAGCHSPEHYKSEADDEVYSIIDSKWQEGYGEKANYKIGDVEPSPNDIQLEEIIPEPNVLSLADAVAIATANNREYKTEKEQLYLTVLALTLKRHNFARQWLGTFDGQYARGAEDEEISYEAETGFSQLLADGAAVSVNIGLDWARFLTGSPGTSLASVLSGTITQPLLRGAGRRIVQEELTQSEREALYRIRSFNRFRKGFVVSIVSAYYRVLQQKDAVTNAENNYRRVLESKERLEMEAEAGRRSRIDVDEAGQNALRAENTLVQAKESYERGLDGFKIDLALPTDADIELDQNELKALEKLGIGQPDYTSESAVETALLRRLDLANSRDKVDDAVRKIAVAEDNLRAELNLVGSTSVNSKGKTDFGTLQFQDGSYTLGIESDLPFDRKSERNAYRRSLITLIQQQRQYEADTDNIKLAVRRTYRQLQETSDRYNIQKNSLKLAEQRVESNKLLLDAGRVEVRILLDSQDALLAAQDNVTKALVEHLVAKLSLYQDVGILQVRPDGMWEQSVQ